MTAAFDSIISEVIHAYPGYDSIWPKVVFMLPITPVFVVFMVSLLNAEML